MPSTVREWLAESKKRGMELGLERVHATHQALLQEPYQASIVHIAGSNGKGTLCATLAAHLDAVGYSTVMFTSPHLVRVEERIRIGGRPINAHLFDDLLLKIRDAELLLKIELTYFEITFLVACLCAQHNNVDFFIVETGLGGRYDATRILPADVCVLTSLSLEHRDILGDTLAEIAAEKAAIARPGKVLIVRNIQDSDATAAIESEARNAGRVDLGETKQGAYLEWVDVSEDTSVSNEAFLLAKATLESLDIDADELKASIQSLNWPGRFQEIPANWSGSILFDAAHNPSGLAKILPQLQQRIAEHRSWTLVFGCTPQHDLLTFSEPLIDLCRMNPPQFIILTEPQFGRYPAVSLDTLQGLDWPASSTVHLRKDANKSYAFLNQHRPEYSVVLGSLYLVGEMFEAMGLLGTEHMELFPAKTQRDEA